MKIVEDTEATGLIGLVAGFLVWVSALITLYAVLSIGCVLGWERIVPGPVSVQRLVLILLWAAHILALLLIVLERKRRARHASLRKAAQEPRGFFDQAILASTIAALGATLWTGAPIFHASTCV